jgi:hypothetical protein
MRSHLGQSSKFRIDSRSGRCHQNSIVKLLATSSGQIWLQQDEKAHVWSVVVRMRVNLVSMVSTPSAQEANEETWLSNPVWCLAKSCRLESGEQWSWVGRSSNFVCKPGLSLLWLENLANGVSLHYEVRHSVQKKGGKPKHIVSTLLPIRHICQTISINRELESCFLCWSCYFVMQVGWIRVGNTSLIHKTFYLPGDIWIL